MLINAVAENVRNLNETPPIIQVSGGCTQDFTAGTDGIRQEIHGLEQEVHKLKLQKQNIMLF